MADDNKKNPFEDTTAAQDQQKGGEASATDEELTGLSEDLDTDVPTDTSDLGEDTTLQDDTSMSEDEEDPSGRA